MPTLANQYETLPAVHAVEKFDFAVSISGFTQQRLPTKSMLNALTSLFCVKGLLFF
jgi:hypothetical protein